MRNFITLDLSRYHNVTIQHNDAYLALVQSQFVSCVPGTNVLVVHNLAADDIEILRLEMFDLGSDRLKFFGQVHKSGLFWQGHVIPGGSTWSISYQYPVFSWLHKVLNLGTIIRPVSPIQEPKNVDRLTVST